jgi:hypothetical protein
MDGLACTGLDRSLVAPQTALLLAIDSLAQHPLLQSGYAPDAVGSGSSFPDSDL